jgi:alkyl sulfatase BDS1-like metallo-beta-lactamase superfamily hydrolase
MEKLPPESPIFPASALPCAESPDTGAKEESLPIEVVILTQDHEIRGLVYVSRKTREERRLSDLLNDPQRRFLAVTDVELLTRHNPSAPRRYAFLQMHIDSIIMIHPSTQRLLNKGGYTKDEASRFEDIRAKFRSKEALELG